MTDATLKQGVSEEGSQGDTETSTVRTQEQIDAQLREDMNPSNRIRGEAAKRYNESRRQALDLPLESSDEGTGDDTPAPAPVSERVQEEPVREASKPATPPLPVYLKDGEYFTKLKVDGQEREVPYSRVQATMQKHEAADRRLQHATELLRNAEAREREAQERAAQLSRTVSQSPQGTGDESLDSEASEIIDKLLDGDADTAKKDLAAALRKGRVPQIDPAAVEERAARRALSAIEQAEWQRDLDQGQRMFLETYGSVINDPDLANIANQKTIQIMREKPYLKPSEVMKEAGDYVMEKFLGGRKPSTPNAGPDPQREERKRNLVPIPRSVNTRQTPPPEKPAPTKQDWLAEQRRRRGQRY